MDENMSSVSNNSKFSIKSQQIIAAQDDQIAKMRKLLLGAGIDPAMAKPELPLEGTGKIFNTGGKQRGLKIMSLN